MTALPVMFLTEGTLMVRPRYTAVGPAASLIPYAFSSHSFNYAAHVQLFMQISKSG